MTAQENIKKLSRAISQLSRGFTLQEVMESCGVVISSCLAAYEDEDDPKIQIFLENLNNQINHNYKLIRRREKERRNETEQKNDVSGKA